MKALLIVRPDAKTRFGGDTTLAHNTARALRAFGVEAEVAAAQDPDPRGHDLAHIFGIFEPEVCARQIDACKRARLPLVVSPIWLDLRAVYGVARACERAMRRARTRRAAVRALERLRALPIERHMRPRDLKRLQQRERMQADLLRSADALIPNSSIEARDVAVVLGVHEVPFVVAPIPAGLSDFRWAESRAGVACVARVETRKNQAMLLLALREDPIDVTLAGDPYDDDYFALCRRSAGPRAEFLGRVSDAEVRALHSRALVHAMPSWCETAGMASLEAALAGAQLVVGDRGAEIEYFGDDAEYADPADPLSVRAAVLRALARPQRARGDSLDLRVRRLTWRLAAERTKLAYEIALGREQGRAAGS